MWLSAKITHEDTDGGGITLAVIPSLSLIEDLLMECQRAASSFKLNAAKFIGSTSRHEV